MVYQSKRYIPPHGLHRKKKGWRPALLTRLPLPRRRRHPETGHLPHAASGRRSLRRNFSPAGMLPLFLLLVLGLLLWGGGQFLAQMGIFRVTELRLVGGRMVTERQALDLAGLRQGINLLAFNAGAAEKKIAAHPWVEKARIKKRWPSGVLVELQEYVPFALIHQAQDAGEGRLHYIDYAGHVIAPVREGDSLDFPVISDVEAEDIAGGSLAGRAGGALQLLHFAARGNALLPLQSVSEVRISAERGLVLYLADHPFPIYFGDEHLQSNFDKLLQVLRQLYDSGEINQVSALEMAYGDNLNKMLCRWVQPR